MKPQGFTWGGLFEDAWSSVGWPFCTWPESLRLDQKAETGDVVVLPKLAVFGKCRDLLQVLGRWNQLGVRAYFVAEGVDTSALSGKVLMQIAAECVEMRRSHRSERMQVSLAQRKSAGKAGSGRPPYGFKHTGKKGQRSLVDDPFTRKIGLFVVRQRLAGVTYERIYWYLIRSNQRTRRAKEWTITTLRRMFKGECRLLQKTAEGLAQLEEYKREGLEKARAQRRPDPEAEAQ